MSDKVVEKKNLLRVSIDFIENSNKGAVFDYIRQSIKLFIFHSLQAPRFRLYGDRLFGGRCCLHSRQVVFESTGSKTPQAIGHASPQLKQSQAMAD